VGLIGLSPAAAGEEATNQDEIQDMKTRLEKLEKRQATLLEQTVEDYLEASEVWQGAQADSKLDGVSIKADFTSVFQGTVGLDPANRAVVGGVIDLEFDFTVTEKLDMFIYMVAATLNPEFLFGGSGGGSISDVGDTPTTGAGFPTFFGSITTPQGESFGRIAGVTFSGWTDGIGVDGNQGLYPGSVNIYEAGITHALPIKDNTLYTQIGALDPRRRFLQNRFADDEKTLFINNVFDDSPSILWLTDASGRRSLGFYQWFEFGGNKQFNLSWGWFNVPGQFFNQGQFYIQFGFKTEVKGQEMNIRLLGFIDEFFVDASGSGSSGGGLSWDWAASEKVGLFAKITWNADDVNPIELDGEFGVVLTGIIGSRPDDQIGVAFAYIKANTDSLPAIGLPTDSEKTLEIYYRYVLEDGKLQITPHLMFVVDPGGNGAGWQDDLLVILGLRVHVPF
jgi:hypothetical protein